MTYPFGLTLAVVPLMLALAHGRALAQLTIENPQHLPFPAGKAELILRNSFHVVAEEYRQPRAADADFPVVLVLGEEEEHYEENETAGVFKVCLKRWDDQKFALAVMRVAVQRLVHRSREKRMLDAVLRRTEAIGPSRPRNCVTTKPACAVLSHLVQIVFLQLVQPHARTCLCRRRNYHRSDTERSGAFIRYTDSTCRGHPRR